MRNGESTLSKKVEELVNKSLGSAQLYASNEEAQSKNNILEIRKNAQ